MKTALKLAARALGQTTPNPAVGAVIVRDGKVIAKGYHKRAGADHAEVAALKNAKQSVRGATMYVSLEPCAHFGRTPPCVRAIIEAGVARVVVGARDPNSTVKGGGVEALREAGVTVDVGLMRDESIRLNEAFFHFHLKKRPLIVCKWAMTMDGQAASVSGDSKWITNDASRKYVHKLRSQAAAVLAGIGTVISDNPSLNVRLPRYRGRQPCRVIADGALRTPVRANCVLAQPGGQTWFLTTSAAARKRVTAFEEIGCRVIPVAGRGQILDLPMAIRRLGAEGLQSIFVEGGPTIHAALIQADLCDKAVAFIAPKIIGIRPHYRRNTIYGWGQDLMTDASALHEIKVQRFGTDVCFEGDFRPWRDRFGIL